MDCAVVEQTREHFREFARPRQVVVHDPNPSDFDPDVHCLDCQWVSESLGAHDCDSLYSTNEPFFHRIALDCLNVDAFLHFLPALFKQSFGAEGRRISDALVWILGVNPDDWDSDQTISQQMAPRLNANQLACVLAYLHAVRDFHQFDPRRADELSAAISFWSQPFDANRLGG